MVEVFKTNVSDAVSATMILSRIHRTYVLYEANFDLQDCDRILRVKSLVGEVQSRSLIRLLNGLGFRAEVLTDDLSIETSETQLAHS